MSTTEPTAPDTKATLRRTILTARAALPPERRRADSAAIVDRLPKLPAFSPATTIAAYVGFDTEIDTAPFLAQVVGAGKRLLLPRIVDVESRERRHLVLHAVEDMALDTRPGRWGILEPDPGRCPAIDPTEVDLLLLPGVAFDRAGGRLGYGAGFYDRLLPTLRPDCLRVAAAFSIQVVPAVPMEDHDQRFHWLVTEDSAAPA
jgi:5-formyltetrahydrofolate cyclo-ligase